MEEGDQSTDQYHNALQNNIARHLQSTDYGQYDFDSNPKQFLYDSGGKSGSNRSSRRGSHKNQQVKCRGSYEEVLPIDQYPLSQIRIEVHDNNQTETVVIVKRTAKTFIYHADNYYRDKTSKRNNYVNQEAEKPLTKDIKKFYKKRYYLFSKFDRGIKIDEESWYSVTPETIAKHIAARVNDSFGKGVANVLDGFCGVGGNLIQFGRKCGFCVGVDLDPVKAEYAYHNSGIYGALGNVQIINKDYLQLLPEDITYPLERRPQIDAVFLSPPWGGTGYNLLKEYELEHVYPDFTQILAQALQFSKNLMIFLPRNTSIQDLIAKMLPFASQIQTEREGELVLEIEQLTYGESCKGILVCTGELARTDSKEIAQHFYSQYCSQYTHGDDNYLKQLLSNIFKLCGYKNFVKYFKSQSANNISLSKVIKKIQSKFSEEEWSYLKKLHKKSRTNSKISSTLSHASMEEEKYSHHSETNSVTSGKKSTSSSQKGYTKKSSRSDKLTKKYSQYNSIINEEEGTVPEEDEVSPEQRLPKKVVHFGEGDSSHIELKDLTEHDFLDLIENKNQDRRFYGWLHFYPHLDHTNPGDDIEYFRQLYDDNLFNNEDVTMQDERANASAKKPKNSSSADK